VCPANYKVDVISDAKTSNSKPQTYIRPAATVKATIHDISGDEDKYTLDSHGFQYVKHESIEKDFNDGEKIKEQYYPEIEQLLKDK
jgi:hypothetical protein